MPSHQGLKGNKKRKCDSDTTNSKPTKISNTTQIQQKVQCDSSSCDTESEFKIHSGGYEYDVQRISDGFLVKTSTSEKREPAKKSSQSVEPSQTEEERSPKKLTTSNIGCKSQKSALHSYKKPSLRFDDVKYIQNISIYQNTSIPKCIGKEDHTTKSVNKNCRELLNLVHQAIKLQKIFSIGNSRRAFSPIRKALKARGWVEKCTSGVLIEDETHTKTSEIINRLLKECDANFIWVINNIDFGNVRDGTIVSRFPKSNHFTTKVGLCGFLDEFHWFYEPDISKAISPRTFAIVTEDDIDNFIKEFGLTACVALLKIIVNQVTTAESDQFFRDGKVPVSIVDFAHAQCSEYIQHRQHDNIDQPENSRTTAREWTDFLNWFNELAHEDGKFQTTSYPMIQALYTMSKMTLKNIKPYWPLFEVEGWKNLWVVKPAADYCGRGIKVMKNLEDIICSVETATDLRMGRHIVQKYIERPLLIYNTKFDIRQWFLITSVYPLTIWFYKECYLRFSSQPFSLLNLQESIHLTNNAIQRKYSNNRHRDPKLPDENMWHSSKFQDYLSETGEPDTWDTVILPGMKQGIVGAVLASQDEMIDRTNSFELYGADFLLGIDYVPILLEINMGPAMHASTKVTGDICKRGLEDVIKVVLDRKHNVRADTGKFEILYRQEMGPKQHNVGLDLMISGSKITPEKRNPFLGKS